MLLFRAIDVFLLCGPLTSILSGHIPKPRHTLNHPKSDLTSPYNPTWVANPRLLIDLRLADYTEVNALQLIDHRPQQHAFKEAFVL